MPKIRNYFSVPALAFLFLLLPVLLQARVKLPAIIGDSMVLQQLAEVPLWGEAKAGSGIMVKTGWDGKDYYSITDEKGKWELTISTPAAGGPFVITINDLTLKGVMIGEVWFCSGQSNMQWAVKQCNKADEEIAAARYPSLRFFTVARDASYSPKSDCKGKWNSCSPSTAVDFSATAYYFGREIHLKLGVPVGLIHSSWGGSPAEAWTRKEILESDEELRTYLTRYEKKRLAGKADQPDNMTPSALYNAMVTPVIPFAIKGVIWYQGEANRNEAGLYEKLFPAMIANWRTDWSQGEFPFYYVQIAPFDYDEPVSGALLRDAQRKALAVPNTGMAVTLDIGDPGDIHPGNKQDVGKRLALLALAKSYGMEELAFSGPLYRSMSVEKGRIRVQFDHIGSGLLIREPDSCSFLIAGDDAVFMPATVVIDGNDLLLGSPGVLQPVAVRYAFENTSQACLYNKEGLPASTFRTDDWPVLTEKVLVDIVLKASEGTYLVTLSDEAGDHEIRYTLDGSEPGPDSRLYTEPFPVQEACRINARAFAGTTASLVISTRELEANLALGMKVDYKKPFSPKYTAGGETGLVDGLRGSTDFLDGAWQGFRGDDLELVIDLGQKRKINQVSTGFLSVENSWIFLPTHVDYSFSDDGKGFQTVVSPEPGNKPVDEKEYILNYSYRFDDLEARYIKVIARNRGTCPSGHPGAGEKAWIFADEVVVK